MSSGESNEIIYKVRLDTTQAAADLKKWAAQVKKEQDAIAAHGRKVGVGFSGGGSAGGGSGGGSAGGGTYRRPPGPRIPGATPPKDTTAADAARKKREDDKAKRDADKKVRDDKRAADKTFKDNERAHKEAGKRLQAAALKGQKELDDKSLAQAKENGKAMARAKAAGYKAAWKDEQGNIIRAGAPSAADIREYENLARKMPGRSNAGRGGGSGSKSALKGGLWGDLARAAMPDHYVRSYFRVNDALGAINESGGGGGFKAALAGVNGFGARMSGGLLSRGGASAAAAGGGGGGGGGAAAAGTGLAGFAALGAKAVVAGLAFTAVLDTAIEGFRTSGRDFGTLSDATHGVIAAFKDVPRATRSWYRWMGDQLNSTKSWLGFDVGGVNASNKVTNKRLARSMNLQSAQKTDVLTGIAGNYSRSMPSYGDIGSMFRPEVAGLMSGTAASMQDRLGRVGTRADLVGDLSDNSRRMADAQGRVGTAAGNNDLMLSVAKEINQLEEERLRITEQLATKSAGILQIAQQEANIAKTRLKDSEVSFGLMDKADQRRLIRIADQVKTRGIESLNPQQLRDYRGIGTQDVIQGSDREAQRRAGLFGFRGKLGGGEQGAIDAGQRAEVGVRVDLDRAGIKNIGIDIGDKFIGLLKENNRLIIEGVGTATKLMKEQIKAEVTREFQEKFDQQKAAVKKVEGQARFSRGVGLPIV